MAKLLLRATKASGSGGLPAQQVSTTGLLSAKRVRAVSHHIYVCEQCAGSASCVAALVDLCCKPPCLSRSIKNCVGYITY